VDDLLAAASAARAKAHVPYSGFPVGAALRGASGRVYAGCNVENAAYPQGQCAEASAIGVMVTAGEREIVEVVVVGGGESFLCSPCGGCRQRLVEFAAPEVQVHLCGPEGLRRTVTVGDLLPLAFSGRNLGTTAQPPDGDAEGWREAFARVRPRVAVVLGSGLGAVADLVEEPTVLSYADIPGFPRPTVAGHAGRATLGRIGGAPVAVLQGRVHLYEGGDPRAVSRWLGALQALGVHTLVLTNASGSLRPGVGPGSLVLVEDHVNLQGLNPLAGAEGGPQFVGLRDAYDPGLRAMLRAATERVGVELAAGVYLAVLGPSFETPAEIRAFRALGADLVGMSTVPEVIAARALGMRVVAVSVVTNLAAGMAAAEALSHEQTLAASGRAAADLARLLAEALPEIARDPD
jgi:purine nucleotide phosphorylase/homotetrameric cytidine deaminase